MGCMNYQAAKPNCILDHDENKKTDDNDSSMTMQTLIAKKVTFRDLDHPS